MDIGSVATLASPGGTLVSLYLNHPPAQTAAVLADLVKPLRARAESLDRPAALSLRDSGERILALQPRLDADPSPAFAVFSSEADGIFELVSLPGRVWDVATVGNRPYLRPWRAIPGLLRVGVVVADRRTAWVHVTEDHRLVLLGEPIVGDTGKVNYGGFSGYEEHGARSRAEEETARVWKEAAGRLFAVHQETPLDVVVLAGHQENLEEMASGLHSYLASLPQGRFVVDPRTMTEAVLRQRVADVVEQIRRDHEAELVDRILGTAESGGLAVTGVPGVLAGVNAGAVAHLALAGPFTKPGVVCTACGHLGRSGSPCAVCGADTVEVDDVLGQAVEAVLGGGGKVTHTRVASRLDAAGAAALLRFPLP